MDKVNYQKSSKDFNMIPFIKEYYADNITPVQVLERLKEIDDKVFLLESANNSGVRGRYSFLGFNPKMEIIVKDNLVKIINNQNISILTNEPTKVIESILKRFKSPILDEAPPFTGGLIGYVSYDYYKYTEPVLEFSNPDEFGFNDLHLFMISDLIIFDHFRDKILLVSNISPNQYESFEKASEVAEDNITKIKQILEKLSKTKYNGIIVEDFKPTFSQEEYNEVIQKAKNYIIAGDIFQVVPSNRLKGKIKGSLFPAYRVVRSDNPSPYMYYMQFGDKEIIGTSPETLVRLNGDEISTFPIAGSRPRGKSVQEDTELERDLLSDPKELAEHNMLVDLGRNDIGRIAQYKTVKVEDYLNVQKYSKVIHITSKVVGKIREDVTALEALSNILPAGTLSGAPKIRACQIIEELEKEKRGPYGGAIGYLAFNGNMDMCIAIRSAFKSGENVFVQSGGGIVYDSQEEPEYIETKNKAGAVVEAIKKSEVINNDFSIR